MIPYINFNGNCREAMSFYKDCLDADLFLQTISEGPMANQCPASMQGQIMHSTLTRNGQLILMASDMIGPDGYVPGNNIGLSFNCASEAEINKLFEQLSEGGKILEPVKMQFWGAMFGAATDKFGTRWMLHFDPKINTPLKETLNAEVWINAPKERVWDALLEDESYRYWTSVFHPGSFAEGDWQQGSKVYFKTPEGHGLVSRVAVHQPASIISFEHLGVLHQGVEVKDHPEACKWIGFYETYRVFDDAGGTRLQIEQDLAPKELEWFSSVWQQALAKVKELAEKTFVPA